MNIKLIPQHNLEKLAHKDSWGHRWETRTKLATVFLFVVGVVSLKSLPLLILTFTLVLGAALSMGLPLPYLFVRLIISTPFFLLMALPILLGRGFPPSRDSIEFILLLMAKGLTSLLLMIIVISTQKIQILFNGFSNMKFPPMLVTIFFLAYRYVFLFITDLTSLKRALNSRLYDDRLSRRSIKVYGEVAGGVIIKSLDRSEMVYRAMASRGFDGTIPTSAPELITRTDVIKALIVLGLIIIIKLIEGWF